MHKIHFGTLAMTFPGVIMILLGRWLGHKLLGEDPLSLWLADFYLPWQGIAIVLMEGWFGMMLFRAYPLACDEKLFGFTLPLGVNLAAIFVWIPLISLMIIGDERKGTIDLVAIGVVYLIASAIPFVLSLLAEIYSRLGGYE